MMVPDTTINAAGGGQKKEEMDWNNMDMWTTSPFAVGIIELPSSTSTGAPKVYRDFEIVNMMIAGSAKNKQTKTPRLIDETTDPYCNDDFITKMIQGSKRFSKKSSSVVSGKSTC